MKTRTKYLTQVGSKYDKLSLLLVVVAIIFIAGVFIWFGHQNQQLEQEIKNFK